MMTSEMSSCNQLEPPRGSTWSRHKRQDIFLYSSLTNILAYWIPLKTHLPTRTHHVTSYQPLHNAPPLHLHCLFHGNKSHRIPLLRPRLRIPTHELHRNLRGKLLYKHLLTSSLIPSIIRSFVVPFIRFHQFFGPDPRRAMYITQRRGLPE